MWGPGPVLPRRAGSARRWTGASLAPELAWKGTELCEVVWREGVLLGLGPADVGTPPCGEAFGEGEAEAVDGSGFEVPLGLGWAGRGGRGSAEGWACGRARCAGGMGGPSAARLGVPRRSAVLPGTAGRTPDVPVLPGVTARWTGCVPEEAGPVAVVLTGRVGWAMARCTGCGLSVGAVWSLVPCGSWPERGVATCVSEEAGPAAVVLSCRTGWVTARRTGWGPLVGVVRGAGGVGLPVLCIGSGEVGLGVVVLAGWGGWVMARCTGCGLPAESVSFWSSVPRAASPEGCVVPDAPDAVGPLAMALPGRTGCAVARCTGASPTGVRTPPVLTGASAAATVGRSETEGT
ncbi:hypothetical protein C9F11_02095 [Streptomyces sp. YIM 121038]|nr:hypothetical protein C9F11_02095 [Streptomyces sp. YIM 121038]